MALNKKDENKVAARVYSRVCLVAAVVLLAVGGGLWYAGKTIVSQVKKEVVAQKLAFPPQGNPMFDAKAFPDVQQYAGKQVDDADKLIAYADDFVGKQVELVSGGKTLSEVNGAVMADPQNATLLQQKQIMFEGETARANLKSAYAMWMQGSALQTVGMVTLLGGLVLLGASALNWTRSRSA